VPNSEHSMRDTDATESLVAFYQMILADQQRPDFDWQVKDGTIMIQTDKEFQPTSVTLWKAHNPDVRNFQVEEIGRAYERQIFQFQQTANMKFKVDQPSEGWTAFFVELAYPGVGDIPLKLSTGVVVTPDVYPFENYQSENPRGTMIQ
jgi:PhoPQ-activated pathogenicity-related protein